MQSGSLLRAVRPRTNKTPLWHPSSVVVHESRSAVQPFRLPRRTTCSFPLPPRSFSSSLRQRIRPTLLRRLQATRPLTSDAAAPPLKKRGRFVRYLYKTFAYFGIFVAGTGIAIVAFFIYDATTYEEDLTSGEIPVSELALNPRRGGPKNLPIVEHFIDDDECDESKRQKHKPKLVILGTGWGNIAMLKKLMPGEYHVTVISASNYFLFTPMLPSGTVGTLELRSLVEPVRRIIARLRGHFIKGSAVDVDFSEKLVEVASHAPDGEEVRFYVPYDKLVVGVGKPTQSLPSFFSILTLEILIRRYYESSRRQGPRTLPLP